MRDTNHIYYIIIIIIKKSTLEILFFPKKNVKEGDTSQEKSRKIALFL